MNDDRDIPAIIYMMAKSDGLSNAEARDAVIKHIDTGCGYNFKRKRELETTDERLDCASDAWR